MKSRRPPPAPRILVLDIGGTHIKVGFSDGRGEIKVPSGPNLGPAKMLRKLSRRLKGQRYDTVSIGYPGLVVHGRMVGEPHNLAAGWVGFNFEKAFHRPTRVVNDAAMQALGSYHGGRMLFLGLGTGLGTAMVVDGKLEPMELAHLPYKKGRTFEDFVGEAGLERFGRKKWQKEVFAVTKMLSDALEPDYVVLGGGNVRKLSELPPLAERGDNRNAIIGGVRLWANGGTVSADTPAAPSRRRATGHRRG
jgi:predicted NBD/HSP70 family sugar kinase